MERDRSLTARTLEELSHELEERLERSRSLEARYKTLFDAVPHALFVLAREDRRVLNWNEAAHRIFGWSRDEVIGAPIDGLSICQMGCAFAMRLMATSVIRAEDVVETVLRSRSGQMVDAEVQGLEMQLGDVAAVMVMIRDVTAQRAAERSEAESTARFQTFFDHAGIAIQVLTADGIVTESNAACTDLLGYSSQELIGSPLERQMHSTDHLKVLDACSELWSGARESVTLEQLFRHRDGTTVWTQLTIARVQRGFEPRLMVMIQDATERKRMEQELVRQAFRDDLTGLANRALFRDRLHHALDRRVRSGGEVAVLLLDLDGFKRVNDSLGHAAGDALLQAVGQRISAAVRTGETVARLGGDEFAIVLEANELANEVQCLADRLLQVISKPIQIAGRDVVVHVSIGVALAEPDDDGGNVLRNADAAMYTAKSAGKQCWRRFDPTMHARAVVWLEMEQDLRGALQREEFVLHFQPLIDLRSGTLRGFEALLRWQHPRRGLLAPGEFLAVAEETGLIVGIGEWVLRDACMQAAGWHIQGSKPLSVSVNLAPRQLEQAHLASDVVRALTASGLSPERLVLEITESQLMRTPDAARATLNSLRELGARVAIDDFGTGYSSLSQLQYLPVDELKIDRSFVSFLDDADRDSSFVSTMIALARSLQLDVVAEGIERGQQHERLTALGCDIGQGYLFSKPLAPAGLKAYLDARCVDQEEGAVNL
jgi:diguanylate cyclase (GGDEF)-like protein/PAS domain S-box-containing protein